MRLALLFPLLLTLSCNGREAAPTGPSESDKTRLDLGTPSIAMGIGSRVQVPYTAWSNGQRVVQPTIRWSSSNPAVANVDSAGWVTGVGFGSSSIKAEWQGLVGYLTVTVAPTGLRIAGVPPTVTMVAGNRYQIDAMGSSRTTNGYTEAPVAAAWASSDAGVSVVSVDGGPGAGPRAYLTAVGAGTAVISATTGVIQASVVVTVLPPLPPESGTVLVQDARMLEFHDAAGWSWAYSPVLHVTVADHAVDIVRVDLFIPGETIPSSSCGALRTNPGTIRDLDPELYGDYTLSISARDGGRMAPGTVFPAIVTYRRGDGTTARLSVAMPVESGTAPKTYTGGYPIWFACAP